MNKVILMGNITQELELKQVNDKQVIRFSIAVNRRFGEETDFFSIVAWNTTATFIEKYFSKGQKIALVGRLQTRSWEDNGKKHNVTEVIAEEVYFTGKKEEKGDAYEPEGISFDNDLPF